MTFKWKTGNTIIKLCIYIKLLVNNRHNKEDMAPLIFKQSNFNIILNKIDMKQNTSIQITVAISPSDMPKDPAVKAIVDYYVSQVVNMPSLSIAEVNQLPFEDFINIFGNAIERCPLGAATVWANRPFSDIQI
ncbi:hypothetical protein KUTeg_024494 [Tegillarca granosa]|uniref:Uncharacterized protein n=1 Tax=Tegillarca granosa TaxID=220873 RepID=A0ABQ9DXI2_TEGGR|nr:hypothetical protein KUTeg_024494 [Tegillarca granosa]